MSYEWNWSQDVEKCPLDLVLSSFTHTNAVQAIALASKECPKFLPEPLPEGAPYHIAHRIHVGIVLGLA